MKQPGTFEQVYASGWHHPGVCWAIGSVVFVALLIAVLRSSKRETLLLLLGLQVVIAVDALFSGTWAPKGLSPALLQASAIGFVVLGDLRYFLLLLRHGFGRRWRIAIAASLLLSCVVPAASLVARFIAPGNSRVLYLVYELMFATIAAVVRFGLLPNRPESSGRRWAKRLSELELVQYLAWATADVIILAGGDVGFALRLVPNVIYYAAFVPFAWATAPKELT